ncbi:ATP-grasp domain-containing protein [Facklamia miroungae]|uniref:5-(Carboxyamino)imidazole ribonucleotide synthase n=1 Tax=Facklamia miroungae TaxID=120956 RepID=A0A1G7TG81_9LACT|nr:ATP-grasp domain-containing protein [Facklamia miroungae]NKZ29845.1 ATP-grasp domain-containing protein [Facklamia miroungae]SDG34338.1 5-(carboxyamino)imidazole ribonucleotide synthase [Facklamia miroungae]
MAHRHHPGSMIGMIGQSITTTLLAQEAGKLGFRVASLVNQAENPVKQFAIWQMIDADYKEESLIEFASLVDMIYVEPGILSNRHYKLLETYTDLALSEDLVAITTDRLIEKVYLDSTKSLVAPFSMVTSIEDIKEAIEYIGYPCVLKSGQRHLNQAKDHVLLFNEEDLVLAEKKVEQATCILEAWIPVEKRVSLTVVRNERGEILIYPPFELVDKGLIIGTQVRYPARIVEEVIAEINRLGQLIAESLTLIGALTLEFFITSSGVIYINQASIGLSQAATFTIGSMSVSQYEACMRAMAGLPLPSLHAKSAAAIAIPIEHLNLESVMVQYMSRTDWGFSLVNVPDQWHNHLEGQVIITGDSLMSCDRQIEMTELYKPE